MQGAAAEWRQFVLLTRASFDRFFERESVVSGIEPMLTVTHWLALVAFPGAFIPFLRIPVYAFYRPMAPGVLEAVTRADKLFFISLTMTVLGYATVIQWDALFPDRRDYRTLAALPVRLRTLFAAKAAALLLFLLLFILAVNAFSTLLFPSFVAREDRGLGSLLRFMGAHLLALGAASLFVSTSLAALRGILMNFTSARLSRRISSIGQAAAASLLLLPMTLSSFVFVRLSEPGAGSDALVRLYPPVWFLGLYEAAAGPCDPLFGELARRALAGVAVAGGLFALVFLAGYARCLGRIADAREETEENRSRWPRHLIRALARALGMSSKSEAILEFTGTTLARSRRHRLLRYAVLGAGIAVVIDTLAAPVLSHGAYFDPRSISFLSAQHVLCFLLVTGTRMIFAIPAELPANWIFQLTQRRDRREVLAGARAALMLYAAVPVLLFLLPLHLALLGWAGGLLHFSIGFVLSLLLSDAVLLGFTRIPFTCTYRAGKANVMGFWALFVGVFCLYAFGAAFVEAHLLLHDISWTTALLEGILLWIALAVLRRRDLALHRELIFDDLPEPLLGGLGLED